MKRLVTAYTFNVAEKTITFTGFTTLELERILLVTNVTKNVIIYNFASTGGTVSTNVLTLSSSLNTTGMSNTDKLQIFYDYPESIGVAGTANADVSTVQGISGGVPLPVSASSLPLPSGAATSALQTSGNTSLTNIDAKLPASLGTKAASASLSVAPAFAATSTLTNVASSTTSVTLLAPNNNRKTVIILNDSTSDLYIAWSSSAASTTNCSIFLAGKVGNTPASTSFTGEDYSGQVTGIWTVANGSARITETS